MGDNQTASSDPNRQLSTLSWWQSGPAELAEWERIEQLLAAAPAGAVYDPDTDPVARAEFEADAAAAAAREAELRELGTLEQAEPRAGDEAVRDELTRRAGGYVQADVDGWLARALAAHRGHYRDPAAREEAANLLTAPVLAHAAHHAPSSAYMHAPNLGWAAYLFPDFKCDFDGDRESEAISFRRNDAYNDLNGHSGRAKRYGYFWNKGKWTRDKPWGVTEQTLYLNDRAGCVSVGSFQNTGALRPHIDGDM